MAIIDKEQHDLLNNLSKKGKNMNFLDFLSPLSSLIGNGINYFSQKKTNETNKEINQQQLDYNAAMTRESWARDDTAHQREVADLEAAGLSPLANTTGNQVTAPLSAPSPIAMQAPQIDANSIMNGLLRNKEIGQKEREIDELIRKNKKSEDQRNYELELEAKRIVQHADELDIENKKVEGTIKYQAQLIEHETKALNETIKHNENEEDLRRLEYESNLYNEEIKKQVGGDYAYKDYYNLESYQAQIIIWNAKYKKFINDLQATQSAKGSQKSTSADFKVGSEAAIGGGAGGSHSEGSYSSQNISKKQDEMIKQFYSQNPKPVYHMSKYMRDRNKEYKSYKR